MMRVFAIAAFSLAFASAPAQTSDLAAAPPLAPRVAEMLRHAGNGHSPEPDEIASMTAISPLPETSDLQAAVPLLLKALDNSDTAVRTYALTTLAGLQSASPAPTPDPTPVPDAAASTATTPAPVAPAPAAAAYKPDVATLLTPGISKIAQHLTEESTTNRILTANVLGGFSPSPPSAVFPPLYAFLRRDDGIGQVGLAVVSDLLQLGPLSAETAEAVSRFLRRSDQNSDSRANIADAIATRPYQSQALNKTLLTFIDADDPSLRSRVILSLPQLDLAPDAFKETQDRVTHLADNPNENLQVVNAAKAVAPCWTSVKMTSGCPVY